MYYEVFEEIKHAQENSISLKDIQLINKSLIDSFYEIRSQINPIYKEEDDYNRIVGKNYSYILYQKIISGIAKSIFLGVNPWSWDRPAILPSGRLSVPLTPLLIDSRFPLLFFRSTEISYENSSIKKWEDEVIAASEHLNSKLGVSITREGFRANLNRILEILFSMRSDSSKRRTNWTIFLHDLIILQKSFTKDELTNFQFDEFDGYTEIVDPSFKSHNYLEFLHLSSLSRTNSSEFKMALSGHTAIERYSSFNSQIISKIPLCHFYVNEHMFIGKEEYTFEQYLDFYVYSWTKSPHIHLVYLENGTSTKKTLPLNKFKEELGKMKYSLLLGFFEERDGKVYYSAEPKMVKD